MYFLRIMKGPSWPLSYGSWIYNYLCNQCLSPQKLWVRISFNGDVYSIQYFVIKLVSDLRQVCGFLQVLRIPPQIKLTATKVESGVKHHNPNPQWTNDGSNFCVHVTCNIKHHWVIYLYKYLLYLNKIAFHNSGNCYTLIMLLCKNDFTFNFDLI